MTTPARPSPRRLRALSMAALLLAPVALAQLLPTGAVPAAAGPPTTTAAAATEPGAPARTTGGRDGAAQAPPGDNVPGPPSHTEPAAAQTGPDETPVPEAAVAETAPSQPRAAVAEPTAQKPASAELTAFLAALAAAERANENLAARLAQMEASSALQRERDQAFIRDMIRGVLILAGGMATIGMIALVAIVYLQVRSTKQQALTFAAQLQALTGHVALPEPPGRSSALVEGIQNQFESTANKIEQKLGDLEAMASGLPAAARSEGFPTPGVHPPVAPPEHPAPQRPPSTGGRDAEPVAPLDRANTLLVEQQPEVAIAYIDEAIKQNPGNPEAYLIRGAALERLNRLDEAIESYDRAIESDGALSAAFLAKAGVLNKLQRYAEALKCYEVALAQQGGQQAGESSAA